MEGRMSSASSEQLVEIRLTFNRLRSLLPRHQTAKSEPGQPGLERATAKTPGGHGSKRSTASSPPAHTQNGDGEDQQKPLPAPNLLTIAPELRNTIYELVLPEPGSIAIPSSGRPRPLPLLQVSQKTAAEAGGIYYGQNTFKARVHSDNVSAPTLWLLSLPQRHLPQIRRLVIEYDMEQIQLRLDDHDHDHDPIISIRKNKTRPRSSHPNMAYTLPWTLALLVGRGLDAEAIRLPVPDGVVVRSEKNLRLTVELALENGCWGYISRQAKKRVSYGADLKAWGEGMRRNLRGMVEEAGTGTGR
jgi:hypothetical protein